MVYTRDWVAQNGYFGVFWAKKVAEKPVFFKKKWQKNFQRRFLDDEMRQIGWLRQKAKRTVTASGTFYFLLFCVLLNPNLRQSDGADRVISPNKSGGIAVGYAKTIAQRN